MSQNVPTTIGKYQIIREIARSNDIVYEAYDPKMNRRVAVKELHMPGGASQQQKENRIRRFEREARAAGSLVHPNIVTVYEVGTDGALHFLAMEFLTGRNLRKEIDKSGFVEPLKAVEIALEVLEGLSFAHEHGVIHRDIKPDNVQLLEDGQIKLTDFGIARLTFEPNITMDGQVFGTPSYMSPEQINGGEIDARSDIFSVGVLLYEMVSGNKPFQGDSVVSITYAIMNKRPDQPAQCGFALWQIIERSLEKSPELRYKSAGEMIRDLQAVRKGMITGADVIDPAPTQSVPYFNPNTVVAGPPPVYNPYMPGQQQQTVRTPYGTPMPPQPGVYQAPYQPYGQQQQPYVPYAPPTNQVPIYYPPPPRQPLLSAAAKQGIAKFFVAVLMIGATIGFVILVINALTNTKPVLRSPEQLPVATIEDEPTSGVALGTQRPAATRTTAPTASQGQESLSGSSLDDVLNQALSKVEEAMGTSDDATRQELWSQADALFVSALSTAKTDSDKEYATQSAIDAYTKAGNVLASSNVPVRAREAYRHAIGFAASDPPRKARLERAVLSLEQ